jgi:hypothetical protein
MKGGYKINGIPVMGEKMTTGTVFFVDSVTGLSGNSGLDPLHPLATIDQAINKCTANKGDVIYCMPNHAETLGDNATSLVPDIAGISVIGLGHGSDMPELTFSGTSSSINIQAANITFRNLRFIAGISAVAVGVDVSADHFLIEDCMFDFSTTLFDFVIHLQVDAVDYATIRNNRFIAENATAGSNEGIRLDDTHHTKIIGNYFSGDFARAAIIGEDAIGNSLLIEGNYIHNDDTAAASNGIDLNIGFTGMIVNNTIFSLYNTACATLIDPGNCGMSQNWTVNAEDQYAISTAVGAAST